MSEAKTETCPRCEGTKVIHEDGIHRICPDCNLTGADHHRDKARQYLATLRTIRMICEANGANS